MTTEIGFTPPEAAVQGSDPVRRRHVVYLPGYDPDSTKRYRALFAREFTRYAKRFAIGRKSITRAETRADGLVQTWTVESGEPGHETRTTYEVLLWDDIVRADFRRPLIASMALLTAGILHSLLTGKLFRLYGLNWKYGNVILYPFGMTVILGGSRPCSAPASRISSPAGCRASPRVRSGRSRGSASCSPPPRSSTGSSCASSSTTGCSTGSTATAGAPITRRASTCSPITSRMSAGRAEVDEVLIVGHSSGG